MITADDFIIPAVHKGYSFYTGVPCSFLSPFINRAISSEHTTYIGAASEGEAVGIAAGAWLAGRKTVVMCQNSGLGNCVNPLTSLNFPFKIPTLLITTWRGQPGVKDEPQHELMSQITHSILEIMRIRNLPFPKTVDEIATVLEIVENEIHRSSLPFGLVMEKGTVKNEPLDVAADFQRLKGESINLRSKNIDYPTRFSILEKLVDITPTNAAIIANTGKCGRELFTIDDKEQHLYQVGSMGCAVSMGLGISLNSYKPVIVLDGDGAALMKLGSLATVGAYAGNNLIHVILDNGVHDSTGGQSTVSPNVNFMDVAIACGYNFGITCDSLESFVEAFEIASLNEGPTIIHAMISPGSIKNLGRPNISPETVALRFKEFLQNT